MHLPLALLWTSLASISAYRPPANAVLLSQVQTLTLYSNRETAHRRVRAVEQLKCIGGNAKGLYEIEVMRCQNSGSDYTADDIQWTCKASLPPEFKLGSTEVSCEGYDSSEDPYVLKGSCGVEYTLVLTEMGRRRYGRDGRSPEYDVEWGQTGFWGKAIFWLVVLCESDCRWRSGTDLKSLSE